MALIAVIGEACTTTSLALAAAWPDHRAVVAEFDTSGGDIAAWLDLPADPGMATVVASTPHGSLPTVQPHLRPGPGECRVLTSPTRAAEAAAVVREAAVRVAPLLAVLDDFVAFADCGHQHPGDLSSVVGRAQLVLVTIRQASAPWRATAARLDRTSELVDALDRQGRAVSVAVVGDRPYEPAEVAAYLGGRQLLAIAEDPAAASMLKGGAVISRRFERSRLHRSALGAATQLSEILAAAATPARQWGAA